MIIDAHCHAGTGDGLTGPWDTRASLERYEARARRAGIDRTILLPIFDSDYRLANRRLAAIVARKPSRYWGFAFIHPERDRGRVLPMVREAVEKLGLMGIKTHRHDARLTREVCEAARQTRVPILHDVMGEVDAVRLFAAEYPDVDFIIPHLGSFADDWRAQTSLLDLLQRYPNVYTDTSGVRRFDILLEAAQRAGPGKILFGTDGPWLHPQLELAKVRALGLSARGEAMVLGGNVVRLLRRSVRVPVRAAACGCATLL